MTPLILPLETNDRCLLNDIQQIKYNLVNAVSEFNPITQP